MKAINVWFKTLVISFLCVLFGQIPTRAQVPAVTFFQVSSNAVFNVNATVGYSFKANSTFNVPALGFYDLDQNGLKSSHPVGLWSSAGTLLGDVTIGAGTSTPIGVGPRNGFRYAPLPAPITLSAGETYYVGGLDYASGSGQADGFIFTGNLFAANSQITYLQPQFNSTSSTLAFPGSNGSGGPGFFGGSFLIASAPEPTSMILMIGSGLMFLARRRRA